MGENTKIEWAHHTFNPWLGCQKVSSACDHCYAESWSKRTGQAHLWNGERRRTTPANWQQPIKWNREAEAGGIRFRVFCASLADVFDNKVPVRWRDDLWHRIEQTPNLDWLVLTKRPQNITKMLPNVEAGHKPWGAGWDNVWLGTTAENQEEADRRIPHLLAVPAAKRFLSVEPLLGHLDVRPYLPNKLWNDLPSWKQPEIDWVIVGGESGPGARPMHPGWARSLRDQCQAAGIPYLFKQWGEWYTSAFLMSTGEPVFRQFDSFDQWVNKASTWVRGGICLDRHGRELKSGADMAHARDSGSFPVTIMHRTGKKAAGRLLDGRTWDEVPA